MPEGNSRMRLGVIAVLAACACAGLTVPAAHATPAKTCAETKTHRCPVAKPKAKPKPKAKAKPQAKPPLKPPRLVAPPPCSLVPQGNYLGESALLSPSNYLPSTGTLRVLFLFVDFPDAPGTVPTQPIAQTLGSNLHDFYADASYGRLDVQWAATPTWIRMPEPSTAFPDAAMGGSVADPLRYEQEAVAAADASVDFSQYDTFAIVVPGGTAITRSEAQLYPVSSGYGAYADGAKLRFFMPLSSEVDDYPGLAWTVAAHELGHLLGLPDLYDTSTLDANAQFTYVGSWDPMSDNWDGHELLAWQRYRLGWINHAQLGCLSAPGTLETTVSPVESAGGTKALVVDLGTRDVVAEVRQPIGFDRYICSRGVLVMTVDQLVDSGLGPIRLAQAAASPTDQQSLYDCGFMSAAPFSAGQTYVDDADGVTIQIESANADGSYTLRATRT